MDTFDLGWDAFGLIRETLHVDEERHGKSSGTVTFTFDPDYQLAANAQMRNDGTDGWNAARDMRKIIELDPGSYLLIAQLNGVRPYSREHDEIVLKLARSRDWKQLRTGEGDIRTRMVE